MQLSLQKINQKFNLVWLRRNLRLYDNRPILQACKESLPIMLLFIFDSDILTNLEQKDDARVNFIHNRLNEMNEELNLLGASILILHGKPRDIFEQIFQQYSVQKIFHAEDFEPQTILRDESIAQLAKLHQIEINTCLDHVIFHPTQLTKSDDTPYKVYTPFSKLWINSLTASSTEVDDRPINKIDWLKARFQFPTLSSIGFEENCISFSDSSVSNKTISLYNEQRNFPAIQGTSQLGIHLRFGTISIRQLVSQALNFPENTFLKQLIWREFFIQIMFHYPTSMQSAFKEKYRDLPWKFSQEYYERWKNGMTGIPIVDAGMRELSSTGTMHNRVRMITASWLTKNLLIDWRIGERYFASKLLDFELASNVGSWQWVAGTGCDSAPYFRIFNPFTQAKKFDPQQVYIRKWIPELDSLDYPAPMIDYKASRTKCLEFYKNNMRSN